MNSSILFKSPKATVLESGLNPSRFHFSSSQARGQHFVRLNSIEPNTVMFSTKDYPILNDISVPEIIDDELARKADPQ